ncbi:MAG: hypothetical protein PHI35_09735, partial [Victivallaceae bacterium]|nr:hypothetical protein [Victivallaceae bacterium]
SDGPKLLIEVTSFEMNCLRATLVVAMGLVILAGLGCAFGGFMSLPTAIFTAVSYLLFGSLSTYILGQSYIAGAGDLVSRYISAGLLKIVIPLQVFDVTARVSDGELVEFSYMGELLYLYAPRALVLFALGIWLYRKRELGLVGRR